VTAANEGAIEKMPDDVGSAQRLKGRSLAETRSAILDLIRSEGEISRKDLARRSALTEKTISVIVKSLMDSGVVVESGFAKSTGGKRPVLLRLNSGELYAVGITLDPMRCVIVLCALDGREIARIGVSGTIRVQPPIVLDRIAAALGELLDQRGIDRTAIVGVGVASGGRRIPLLGLSVEAAFSDPWEHFPVEEELGERIGLTVLRENDADCAALGEYWSTGSIPARPFMTVYTAHGIGAGIVIGGGIYRGASGNAGEIGHMMADPNGPLCFCGRRGCLQTVASPGGIAMKILEDPALRAACGVADDTPFGEIYRRFGELVRRGDERVQSLFRATADHLANAICDLANALDLDLVSLAGPGFAELGEEYRGAIENRLTEFAYMREVHPITVRLGVGGPDAAALGAASVVLHRRLTPHRSVAPV
jgi:predicted NBD/HSP70 family sugar kinase